MFECNDNKRYIDYIKLRDALNPKILEREKQIIEKDKQNSMTSNLNAKSIMQLTPINLEKIKS